MIFRYSHDYHPPAPVVDIALLSIAEGLRVGPVKAFVDSSADGTLVPIDYLNQIHAPTTAEMSIRSQWGERRRVLLYLVDVQIGGLTLPGVEVVGDELSSEVVLGRDILNRLRVLLDGPKGLVEVQS